MQAERKRKADKERAEGAEIDAKVRADTDRKATIIRADAASASNIIRGCGEAQATGIFANALEQDPEFYSFQRSLESIKKILSTDTTVVMPVVGFGELFEQIRTGIDQATEIENGGPTGQASLGAQEGAKCAEVSAAWYLADDLNVDQPDLTFLSMEPEIWPDGSLGCAIDSGEFINEVPGFNVRFTYEGSSYDVRTDKYGSMLSIC